MNRFISNSVLLLLFALLGIPMLYYAYKFGTPEFGGLDVYSYYKLYSNWDFAAVDSPFNQRILSSYSIYLIHLSGIKYNTETAIAELGLDPQVYFSAILFNFMCVVATCLVIYRTVEDYLKLHWSASFISGLLFLMGFGTLFFLVSALSDALAVLMVALAFRYYLRKSYWVVVVFALAIFQREYVFFIFGLMAVIHWLTDKEHRKYYLIVLLSCLAGFAVYFICRKTIFYTPRYDHQINFSKILEKIGHSIDDFPAYVRQTLMIQNILFLYLGLVAYKVIRKLSIDKVYLWIILLLFAEIVTMSVLVGLGNNTGRYYYMVVPLIIVALVKEASPLLKDFSATNQKLP